MSEAALLSSLDSTEGCLFLAVVFTSVLWGVGNVQLYFYCERHWKTDGFWLKSFVLVAWAMDTLLQCFALKGIYVYLVTDIGNTASLGAQNTWLGDTPLIAGLVDFQVQLLFIYRAWTLSNHNYIVAGTLFLLISGEFAASIVYFTQLYHIAAATDLSEFIVTIKALMSTVVVVDTILAFTLVFLLNRRKQGFGATDSVINRIMAYSIGTGLVTSAWSLVGLGTAVALPQSYAYIMVLEVMPKLYFNCMLSSLNMRQSLAAVSQKGSVDVEMSGITSASSQIATRGTVAGFGTRTNLSRVVEVKTDTDSVYYEDPSAMSQPTTPLKSSRYPSPGPLGVGKSRNGERTSMDSFSVTTRSVSRASRL